MVYLEHQGMVKSLLIQTGMMSKQDTITTSRLQLQCLLGLLWGLNSLPLLLSHLPIQL